jgi:hypothetical protein
MCLKALEKNSKPIKQNINDINNVDIVEGGDEGGFLFINKTPQNPKPNK